MENKSGIHPKGDMILVEPFEIEEKTAFGIVIASAQVNKEQMAMTEGRLVAWGATAVRDPRLEGINLGDFILFAKWAGQMKTGKDDVSYRVMRSGDVMAKLDEPSRDLPKVRMPLNPEAEFAVD